MSARPEVERNIQAPPRDSALLELFRTELQHHATRLHEGLADPAPGADTLSAMRKSAHAIWGGARILELPAVAALAAAIKGCLEAVLAGRIERAALAALQAGVELLLQLAATPATAAPDWIDQHRTELERLTATVEQLTASGGSGAAAPVRRTTPAAAAPAVRAISADPVLLEAFLSELENHRQALNEGLLALEENPAAVDRLEALMRSAHSIKGGARVVGLELAVGLAHIMEDCFVAAQEGRLALGSEAIDALLAGVDLLARIAEQAVAGTAGGLAGLAPEVEQLSATLAAVHRGEVAPVVSPAPTPVVLPAGPAPAQKAAVATATKDRTVRVTAGKIERLVGLTGEVAVSARWLPDFSKSLLALKRRQGEISLILEQLQEDLGYQRAAAQTIRETAAAREKNKACIADLVERLNQLDRFSGALANHSDRLYREMIGVRMRPFADGAKGFARMVRDLARALGKKVQFRVSGENTEVDQDILEKLDAPLTHLLRNAVDHGIEAPTERSAAGKPETGVLRLEAGHRFGLLMITLRDDGRGIDLEDLRAKIVHKELAGADMAAQMNASELLEFLFLPGFSTAGAVTEISGRGVGLDVVRSMVHEVGGAVHAETEPGRGLGFHLELPVTRSVIRTFLVEIAGEPYAFPLARIDRCLALDRAEIELVEDRQYFRFDGRNIALVNIHDVLALDSPPPGADRLSVVVISDRLNVYGLVVDRVLGEYELVVRPLDPRLGEVPGISAVAIMLDGKPVLIFDVEGLVRGIDKLLRDKRMRKFAETGEAVQAVHKKRVLVVDDSITVREMERKLLENRGYEVDIAVDGVEGWNAVRAERYDLLVSDIDMPRMGGVELIRRIRHDEDLKYLPVVVVSYKDSDEHRLQGLEAGANYYLTKGSFEDESFAEAVAELIGEAEEPD